MSKFRYLIIGTLILCVTLSVSLLNFGNDKKNGLLEVKSTACDLERFDVTKYYINNDIRDCLYENIMDQNKTEKSQLEAFNNIRKSKYYNYCHVLTHDLGRYYIKELKIPYRKVMNDAIPTCFDGFAHGVFENLAFVASPTEELYLDMEDFCESPTTYLYVTGCYHEAGHYFYRGSYLYKELKNPFDGCRKLNSDLKKMGICGSGVAMYHMISVFLDKGKKFDNCQKGGKGKELETVSCLLYPDIPFNEFDKYFMNNYCENVPSYQQPACEYGMVDHYVDVMKIDQLIDYCEFRSTDKDMCYHHLVQQMTLSQGEVKYKELVAKLKARNVTYIVPDHAEIYLGVDRVTGPVAQATMLGKRFKFSSK